jgi:hypothetical protein
MAANYRHIRGRENRLGRHYSRFPLFRPCCPLSFSHFPRQNSGAAGRIGEVRLATLSIGGTIIPNDAAPGTYTVNSDCTGTAIVHMTPPTPDVHLQWFVAPDGDQIFSTETDAGTVLTGTLQRVAR